MSYAELLQVATLSSLLTLALALVFSHCRRVLRNAAQYFLQPRYLQSHGVVRRRVESATTSNTDTHEPS